MRVDADGHLIYANPASTPILRSIGAAVGDVVPPDILARFDSVLPERGFVEIVADRRTFAVWPVPITEMNFTNLYGMDVTAERAIAKFPDRNPNPVFRIGWDGMLVYANPASAELVAGLGLAVGSRLPADLRETLLVRVRAADGVMVEVLSDARTYALLPVDVPEFGFISVYGTDVTAVKERERLAQENERLLLNILPSPIADRLRHGEPLIADRFDDVTLMFADIVEFTRLSASMSPQELVGVLNEVFTVFDSLVDQYDLEKVKTIGDAYMVVGGMPGAGRRVRDQHQRDLGTSDRRRRGDRLDPRPLRGDGAVLDGWGLRQFRRTQGRAAGPRRVRFGVPETRPDQGPLGPGQHLPNEPERRPRLALTSRRSGAIARPRRVQGWTRRGTMPAT